MILPSRFNNCIIKFCSFVSVLMMSIPVSSIRRMSMGREEVLLVSLSIDRRKPVPAVRVNVYVL